VRSQPGRRAYCGTAIAARIRRCGVSINPVWLYKAYRVILLDHLPLLHPPTTQPTESCNQLHPSLGHAAVYL
jgi:hypothetical protein